MHHRDFVWFGVTAGLCALSVVLGRLARRAARRQARRRTAEPRHPRVNDGGDRG